MFKIASSIGRSLFSTLLLAEHNGKNILKNTLKLVSAAHKFDENIDILVVGNGAQQVTQNMKSTLHCTHVKKVFSLPKPDHPTADVVQNIVQGLISKYSYKRVMALTSSFGKDVIPRIAGRYQAQPISDIIEILSKNKFLRPTYAGNALSVIKSDQPLDFLTIRPSAFPDLQPGHPSFTIQQLSINVDYKQKSSFISQQKCDSTKPELTTARIVVSGGRGVKSKQNFNIIYQLAEAFGDAAVGASRAAVDAGYCPNEMQVGQTGKVVAPDLYMAIGISGAVQHLAGMKDSKCVVAINNRPDQPIFEIADYGLQADLFKVLPELTEKIKKIKSM